VPMLSRKVSKNKRNRRGGGGGLGEGNLFKADNIQTPQPHDPNDKGEVTGVNDESKGLSFNKPIKHRNKSIDLSDSTNLVDEEPDMDGSLHPQLNKKNIQKEKELVIPPPQQEKQPHKCDSKLEGLNIKQINEIHDLNIKREDICLNGLQPNPNPKEFCKKVESKGMGKYALTLVCQIPKAKKDINFFVSNRKVLASECDFKALKLDQINDTHVQCSKYLIPFRLHCYEYIKDNDYYGKCTNNKLVKPIFFYANIVPNQFSYFFIDMEMGSEYAFEQVNDLITKRGEKLAKKILDI